jgi:3',5'-cyclic AMP phosphodiesterase CpdA
LRNTVKRYPVIDEGAADLSGGRGSDGDEGAKTGETVDEDEAVSVSVAGWERAEMVHIQHLKRKVNLCAVLIGRVLLSGVEMLADGTCLHKRLDVSEHARPFACEADARHSACSAIVAGEGRGVAEGEETVEEDGWWTRAKEDTVIYDFVWKLLELVEKRLFEKFIAIEGVKLHLSGTSELSLFSCAVCTKRFARHEVVRGCGGG